MSFGQWFTALGGAFAVWCSLANYDWFFNNHRAQPFVQMLGRTGARVFYAALGLLLIGAAVFWL